KTQDLVLTAIHLAQPSDSILV
ncbi:hypothetical protein D030_0562B, partial [Vibrio parahaemolyticus AQ3810]